MNDRQAHALTHPITDPDQSIEDIETYRRLDEQLDGNLLLSMLAVDR